ncbi:MAG: hypothetical protein KBF12_10645 [Sebaldella sp.]|nr:hypothetical protein [Sebaldella sp.]
MEQDRVETILSVVDNYTRELERYRNDLNSVTKEVAKFNSKAGNTSGLEKLFASLGGVKGILAGLGIAVGIKEIGKLGLSCIDAASEIKELDNVLEQVFERGSAEVIKWADTISTNVGRASFELQHQAAIFGAVFKGAGIKTDDLHDMSLALSQLAADFSSFYDNDMEQVFNALKSGLTGETEPLKRYGIILNETTAAEYALSQGIKTKWKEMSEAQKQMVRYNFLMEKTVFVQGDAERTIDSYANQVKVLEAYWDNISRTLGQKFIPTGESVLHVINNIMGSIDKMVKSKNIDDYAGQFFQLKTNAEDLYQRYSELSKMETLSPVQEKERLSLYEQIVALQPELLGNLSNEKSKYEAIGTALESVIAGLKNKIILQMQEEMWTELSNDVKKYREAIVQADTDLEKFKAELNERLKLEVNIDTLLNEDVLKKAKAYLESAGDTSLKADLDNSISKLVETTGRSGQDAEELKYALEEYTLYFLGQEEKKINAYDKALKIVEDGKNKIATNTEVLNNIFGSFSTNENNILSGQKNMTAEMLAKLDSVQSANARELSAKAGGLSGQILDSKDKVIGELNTGKKDIKAEMLSQHADTRGEIRVVGDNLETTITSLGNGLYKMVQRNLETKAIIYENTATGDGLTALGRSLLSKTEVGKTVSNETIDRQKGSGLNKGKKNSGSSKDKKAEKDKWEQMLESLNKQIKDFSVTSSKVAGEIKNAREQLDKLELDKIIDFAKALDWGQADLIQSFIKIKETSRDLARSLGDKSAVEKYTLEIKKLNEQLFFANTSKEYKKKTEEVKYDVKSDGNKEVYNELIKNIEEFVTASKNDLDKRYSEGTDDYSTYLDKQLKLFEGIEDTFDKLGLANEKLSASIDKDRVQREKNQNSVVNQIEEIKAIAKYTNEPESETNKKIADVYKNSTEIIAKSIYDLTKQLEKLEKNPINETKSEVGNKEVPVQGIEKINKSANELQEELTFINSEIKNFQSILTEVNNHLSKLPENLKTKQEKDFQRNIDLWKKMLNSAYVKKEQLEYSLGYTNNNIATSSKKDGEETGLLTVEDKKTLQEFNTKLGEQLKYITRGINIDFSSVNTVEDVKTWYDGIKKMLSNLTGPASSNKNKAINEGFGLLLSTLEEILKTDSTREVVKSETVKSVNLTEVQKLLELMAVSTKDLEEAKKNEKVAKEETRKTNLTDDFKKGIEDLFLNINTSDIQNSLISGVKDLFDKAVQGTDISGIYNKKFSDAFGEAFKNSMEGFTPSGNYLKDQEEQQKRFIESLRELSNSSDSAVRSIANLTLFDTVKGQLDELAQHLSNAGEVLKDDFLKNLAVTVESLSALAESLKNTSLTSNSKIGGMLGGIGGFLSNVTGTIGMVTGLVSTGVGLFKSAGNLLGFGSSKKQKAKNEEERKKAAEWYEKQFKENTDLIKSINDLTGSIIDLNTKLIQNIASNTSDKNINKQKNYYDNLIRTTGSLFNENITATGHSTKKKKKLFGSKTKDSYSTLNQSFDDYFGDAWKYTARDSKSLEQFYDSYLKNFDMNNLKRKLGKNSIDNSNIDEVKSQFLRFIDDIKTMEIHSKNLPKNGILESFDGVEVLDVFELRNEYQKQLENIYKGMGKDPEKYKEEILNQVNALIQNGETIISAFNDVKSSFYGKIIEGDDTIMSLGTGLESYFTKLRTNISKIFYDINFQGLEENFNDKFQNISDKLADFRLSGGKDLSSFVNNNLNFWNEFTQLKNTENIKNDMKEVLDILKLQAKGAGLSDEVINAMFPDSEINKKADDIKNALEKAMRDALDTNSFSQFSMSLGDSIYSSVKDGLIEAFYESQTFQSLASKYFLNDDYTKQLEGAGSFKDAYDIIKEQLDKVEVQLQAEGLDFKGTNSSSGEYYGGLSNSYKTPTGLLANDININYTLNNYGFLEADDFLKKMVKTIKEELHESKKKEV